MIGWLFGLLFNLYLIYMAYSFPPLALWLWMGIFVITSLLFITAKDRITGNKIKDESINWSKYDYKKHFPVKKKKKRKRK